MSVSIVARPLVSDHRRPWSWLAWVVAVVAGVVAIAALRTGAYATGEPLCLMRRLAHVACPTCGMTRALTLLAQGEWRAAWVAHPWAPVLVAQLVAAWVLAGVMLARGDSRRIDCWLPHAVALNAAALGVIWLVRLGMGALPAG